MEDNLMETDDFQIVEFEDDTVNEFQFCPSEIRWVEQFNCKEASSLKKRLEEFIERTLTPSANHKWAIQLYIQIFAKHGMFIPGVTIFSKYVPNERHRFPQSMCPKEGNIAKLILDISDTIRDYKLFSFIRDKISFSCINNSKGMHVEISNFFRSDVWYLFHQDYIQGIESHLENYIHLRSFSALRTLPGLQSLTIRESRFERLKTTNMTECTYMALYAILKNRRTPNTFRGEQLIQIIHNHIVQTMYIRFKNDVFVQMCEVLNCALALGLWKAVEEIIELEETILKKQNYISQQCWRGWKLICKYERFLENPTHSHNAFLALATRLADYGEEDGFHENGTIFMEEACKIWNNCENHEADIAETLMNFTRKYPSLGPRMLKLAKKYNIEYELDYLIDIMCDINNGIHPREKVWLDWVSKRMQNLRRYGAIQDTIRNCLKVVFEFLDYGCNRYSERAWLLLHDILQKTTIDAVRNEWCKRYDWWPSLHKKRGGLSENTEKIKHEIFKALNDISVLENGSNYI